MQLLCLCLALLQRSCAAPTGTLAKKVLYAERRLELASSDPSAGTGSAGDPADVDEYRPTKQSRVDGVAPQVAARA